jgi:hypothetical protein
VLLSCIAARERGEVNRIRNKSMVKWLLTTDRYGEMAFDVGRCDEGSG